MIHYRDADVDRVLRGDAVLATLSRAFADFARGDAAMQARVRTEAGAVKLSTLGAILPKQGYAGAKVYTTIAGRFSFVIQLFSARSGAPLATFDANAITRWRTAAVSVLAAQHGANPESTTLAIFGTGVQAQAHLEAFHRSFALRAVRIVSHASGEELATRARQLGLDARVVGAKEALRGAHIIVTATRSKTPLFDGAWAEPGAFIAAVGSSLPTARELDDTAIARSAAIVVEWREQSLREAGDLVLADPALLASKRVVELGEVLDGRQRLRRGADDIVVLKSVGVGLEDIAIAGLAYERLAGEPVLPAA